MKTESADIQKLYSDADRDFMTSKDFTQILLNGFREHADRFVYMMSYVRHLQPRTILDVGCSRGLLGAMYRWQRGYAPELIHGVDISPEAASFAKQICRYDEVFVLDASKPFSSAVTYDLVICTELLEHVPDPQQLIDNVIRAAHSKVMISTPVEAGEVDGTVHVRHVTPSDQLAWVGDRLTNIEQVFVPSQFSEKPHWQGWNFLFGTKS